MADNDAKEIKQDVEYSAKDTEKGVDKKDTTKEVKKTLEPGNVKDSYATGKRKNAIARVYLKKGKGQITVNGKDFVDYFPNKVHQQLIAMPLDYVNNRNDYDVIVKVVGGGVSGQAGAVKHGISKALNEADRDHNRPVLKKAGFLTRDSRVVERKKAGLHKARKAPQFSKR